ncbi:hypothetical protein AN958_05315 [Leucoagaricus sp. SymC.cos]|nr:hypothetical protein AN958_05315 [Leucoagaricus sp. SymC.cos]
MKVLKKLEKCAIPGAEFDSSARKPPPRCYLGTRVEIMSDVNEWLHQPNAEKKLLWLCGPAGVGKSAIMQSIAEEYADTQCLGATLFFSKVSGRDEPWAVWPTVAFQLAVKEKTYRAYLHSEMNANPRLLKEGLREQFRKLIVEPFGQKQVIRPSRSLLILLDGLDECRVEDPQGEIVHLIAEFIRDYPAAPLVWIIASRPEQHLKLAFERDEFQKHLWHLIVPVDSSTGCRDVERYLRSEFSGIQRGYPSALPTVLQWPKEADLCSLVAASSGLFMFATAIIRFIDDPFIGNPMSQLDLILSIIERKLPSVLQQSNPLSLLHALYFQILKLIPWSSYPVTRRILGFLLLERGYGAWRPKATSFWALCNVLGIEQNVAYGALHMLYSVLDIPDPDRAFSTSIRILHVSFLEFLEEPLFSGRFCIQEKETLGDLWQCQLRILQQVNLSVDYPLPQPANVSLAWPSLHELHNKSHRNQLWMRARVTFWDATFRAFGQGEPTGPFVEAVGRMNLYKFADGYELPETRRLPQIFDWFSSYLGGDLERAGLLMPIDVRNSSFDWIQRSMVSFKIEYHDPHPTIKEAFTDSVPSAIDELNPGLKLIRHPISDLLSDLSKHAFHIDRAIVVGSERSGRSAILVDSNHERCKIFYLIPYVRPIM